MQNFFHLSHFRLWTLSVLGFVSGAAYGQELLPSKAPAPQNNPLSSAKIELGKQLYFDPRLSKTGTVSCNSCHGVENSGTDNLETSTGIRGLKGGRNSPSVWNAAFLSVQFWDGRAATLEEQAKGPLTNPVEMGMDSHDEVLNRLRQIPGYVSAFEGAFGKAQPLSIDQVAQAIASFERTLITPNSPYDRYLKGNKKSLSSAALRGLKTVEEVGCTTCHMGALFAGPELETGMGFYQKVPKFPGSPYDAQYELTKDLGRFAHTQKEEDRNMWRVPTWRNVALTAPYFHNGKVKTLSEAVRVMAKIQLQKDLKDSQVSDIVAFLESLTGEFPKITLPRLPAVSQKAIVEN